MSRPLNPALYRRLERLFGTVRIGGEGESLLAKPYIDPVLGVPRLAISHAGEYYEVVCPYCTDTRYRLWINHAWGQKDGHNRFMTFLAVCYNEDCLSSEENRADLIEKLTGSENWLSQVKLRPGKIVPEEACEVVWPGCVKPLAKLLPDHPANRYLMLRHFDPDKLSKLYDVRYCSESQYVLARNRIIIPIWAGGKLRGWQARHIGELPWKDPAKKRDLPPKYFSAPGSHFRSKTLYNFDRARQWQTGVIVEGPADVWSFGSMAMGCFGNTLTPIQTRMFLSVFRKRTGVLLLDPEEYESKRTRKTIEELKRAMHGKFAAVKLPDGTDPGSLDREYLRRYVQVRAAEVGVEVAYKRAEDS